MMIESRESQPLPERAREAIENGWSIVIRVSSRGGGPDGQSPRETEVAAKFIERAWEAISAENPDAEVVGVFDPEAWKTRGECGEADPPEVQLALDRGWAMRIEGELEVLPGDMETVGRWVAPDEVREFWESVAPDFQSIRVVVMGEPDSVPGKPKEEGR
ncbi:hypothetical protein [Kocuria sp. SL71]|uniref:hypothetical protein n=1 Tax=Kocuria sp. SL71 TaxID=2995151 RepID=UPI0022730390|nr:hypothetical protein [Kocuria sp. SL71]MCY1684026.1 hypothetical protein [Kocuria sp. SL71]